MLNISGTPERIIHPGSNPTVKATPLPINRPGYIPVLDGVEMDVVHVFFEIRLVLNCVFPELWLPHTAATIAVTSFGNSLLLPTGFQPTLRELLLNPTPA